MKRVLIAHTSLVSCTAVLALLLLFGGCSHIGDLAAPQAPESEMTNETFEPVIYTYPEAADCPPSGYQMINLHSSKTSVRLDGDDDGDNDYDTTWVSVSNGQRYKGVAKFITFKKGGEVKWHKNKAKFPGKVWKNSTDDLWISMIRTDPPQPWIDFGPHGLIFAKEIEIRVSYADCELPEGVEPADLQLFFWNEVTGEYELHTEKNDTHEMYIKGKTDHFSRYIIAAPVR